MKLLSIKLSNFQGIRSLDMQLHGANAHIYGDNATGKTTVLNAIAWLLFDKPITGSKGFTPKTQGSAGDLHNLAHEAEAEFLSDTGRIITLKKSYHEIYRKKRGSTAEEFEGHTTDYYVDEVPAKEKEYNEAIASFGKSEQLRMLMMPEYFADSVTWQERRKVLLDICGDISDEDVITANPDLAELPEILNGKSVEDYRKIAAAGKSKINKELDGLPGRIDEAQRAIPEISDRAISDIETDMQALQASKAEKEAAKAALLSDDTLASEMRKRIAELEAQAAEARTAFNQRVQQENAGARQRIDDLRTAIYAQQAERNDLIGQHKSLSANAERMAALRADLHRQYKDISAEEWDESGATCPTCKQALPAEDIEAARAAFNQSKSQRLEAINLRGKTEASQTMIEAAQAEAANLLERIAALDSSLNANNAALVEAQTKLSNPTFESSPEHETYMQAMREIQQCQETVRAGAQDQQALAAPYDADIRALNEKIAALQDEIGKIRLAETQRQRIAELEAQEATLGEEYERLERNMMLCEDFVRAKVRMLDERINGRFDTVRFRLFKEQINGGLSEDCEVLVRAQDGAMVPYRDANNAARINAGLEIIDTLGAAWGQRMPVCVDNAESVTQLRPIAAQVLAMVVSEPDKVLRLELDDQMKEAI